MAGFEQRKMADFDVLSPGGIVGSTGIYRAKLSILAVSNQFRHLPVEYSISEKKSSYKITYILCSNCKMLLYCNIRHTGGDKFHRT